MNGNTIEETKLKSVLELKDGHYSLIEHDITNSSITLKNVKGEIVTYNLSVTEGEKNLLYIIDNNWIYDVRTNYSEYLIFVYHREKTLRFMPG